MTQVTTIPIQIGAETPTEDLAVLRGDIKITLGWLTITVPGGTLTITPKFLAETSRLLRLAQPVTPSP